MKIKTLVSLVVCAILAISCVGGKGRKASSAVSEIPAEKVTNSDWRIIAVGQGVIVSSSAPKIPAEYHDQTIFPDVLIPRIDIAHFTVIDIRTQRLACYESGQLVRICEVSTSMIGHDNMLGDWQVVGKTEQPYTFGLKPLAMHNAVAMGKGNWIYEGRLVGRGSIRLNANDAKWYFNWAKRCDAGYVYLDLSGDKDFQGRASDDQDRRFQQLLMK
jgi:hypothetical protein